MTDKERAVIEAAREVVASHFSDDEGWITNDLMCELSLHLAALDADKPVIQKETSDGNP